MAPIGAGRRLPQSNDELWFPFYHEVPDAAGDGLRRHLDALLARGRFVRWDESLHLLDGRSSLRGPHFCLSFDDGHKDWISNVLPVLQELNVPATFFLTTNRVVDGQSRDRLTWSDCVELLAAGMGVGSHSLSHPRLSLLDAESSRREITRSKQEIEQRLGVAVLDFSAPFGLPRVDYGEREVELVQEAGYRSLAGARAGRMVPGQSPYHLARAGLNPLWPLVAVRSRVHE